MNNKALMSLIFQQGISRFFFHNFVHNFVHTKVKHNKNRVTTGILKWLAIVKRFGKIALGL